MGGWTFRRMGLLAYALGAVGLGVQSIGHEYSYRTLGALLAQPSSRRRIYLIKAGVLASMLLVLGAVAWAVLPTHEQLSFPPEWQPAAIVPLAALCGLCIAPWLTMICRNEVAGVVFTIATPLLLLLAGDLLGVARYGLQNAVAVDNFKLAFLAWGFVTLCAVGAVSAWRMFTRLEAIEGSGADVHLPRPLRRPAAVAAAPVRSVDHPLWALTKKELRLQQLTFVVAGLYLLLWTATTVLTHAVRDLPVIPVGALTLIYFGLLAMLIGSLASAEERQFGTLEWQMLVPMAVWKQWTVKVAVALGLALLLGIGLPLLLAELDPATTGNVRYPLSYRVLMLVVLAAASVYVSSLSSSGVRALAVAAPVGFVASTAYSWFSWVVWRAMQSAIAVPPAPLAELRSRFRVWVTANWYLSIAAAVGLSAVLLVLALKNHRSAERGARRIWPQAAWLAAFAALALAASTGLRIYYLGGR
jgi:hypothetical protein